jgi:hypothetical protein
MFLQIKNRIVNLSNVTSINLYEAEYGDKGFRVSMYFDGGFDGGGDNGPQYVSFYGEDADRIREYFANKMSDLYILMPPEVPQPETPTTKTTNLVGGPSTEGDHDLPF